MLGRNVTVSDGDLFVRSLLLILVFGVVWAVLKRIALFSDKEWLAGVLSAIVAILSMRVVGDSKVLEAILLPYSTLGVAITAGIPFFIYFILVESRPSQIFRRIAWVFFAVVFIGLYYARLAQLGGLLSFATWIYGGTAAVAIGMAVFDGTIQGFRNQIRREKAAKSFKGSALLNIEKNLQNVHNLYGEMGSGYLGVTPQGQAAGIGYPAYEADVKAFERRIKQMMK